jgi:hypothetical protein
MEKVTGIGGLFFRAQDPAALGRWYQEHLGVSLTPSNDEDLPWWQEAGPTAFSPFAETSEYFGNFKQVWMVNFRVRDLDAMAAQLRGRITRTATLVVCTTRRAIRLSYGNQRNETLRVRLPSKRSSPFVAHSAQQPPRTTACCRTPADPKG